MKNEEKAKELISGMSNKWGGLMAFHKLTQMAAWKDKQFKEYLEKKRESLYTDSMDEMDECRCSADVLISEIINELFKD